ncbi:T9SS type B sorting domain-containing protein [Zobellia sp. KMM 6746]|uniref:T9SS type B sorting domain-containing protein n=2 Tax=Zobellia barbeyronii TaxID=2748009 RepID=A0ABS5WFE3_9FLAO|nr:T9SS type B sorting domain-containing protein [Zobellia barbeyronii]
MTKLLILLFFSGMFGIMSAQVTPVEKAALLAFYNATDGPNWVSENDADLTNDWDFTGLVTDDWFGITINGVNVIGIDLNTINTSAGNNNLTGILPDEMKDLKELVWLDLMAGELTGPFPDFLFSLDKLQVLNLAQNNFNGFLPDNIGNLKELSTLQLEFNQFTSEIPLSLTTLSNLKTLNLNANALTGEIPVEITQMSAISYLSLGSNYFTGFIYPEYGNLTELKTLILDGNELTGIIPIELGNLNELEYLRIGRQDLIGNIPTELGNLSNLFFLSIRQTQINGPIPIEISNLSSLRYLYLNENQLDGQIQQGLSNLNFLEILTLNGNQLENTIPNFTTNTNLYRLEFGDNRFQFGDFENQFDQYSINLPIFSDNPQSKVNEIETLSRNIGENITLITTVSGAQNHYKWFKDGVAIPDAPDSPSLTLNNVQATDTGVYHAEITSDIVTDLTLVRNDITLNIGCVTPIVDDPQDFIACGSYTLPILSNDNYYYTDTNAGGTQLNEGDLITASQILYVYAGVSGCSNENSFDIQIDSPTLADNPQDVTACESYTLPTLSNFNYYYTYPNAGGTQLSAGDIITASQILYVYAGTSGCSNENDFNIQIDSPTLIDSILDVEVCENYALPILNNGNYFTQTNGTGTELFAGDIINVSLTVYIYNESTSCSNENSFTITIDPLLCEETPEPEISCTIDFPNFFTPNNDGANDNYVPITDVCSPGGTLSIFDRYAKLVFQTNSLDNTWDGTYNGKPLPSSDYWYRFESVENKEVITGHFTLKR